jgi:hypothetical protein
MPSSDMRTCFLCGRRKDLWECERNPILNNVAVCDTCMETHEYSAKNTKRVGKPSKHTPPFSVEFEVAAPCYTLLWRLDRALILVKYGFLRTEDDSVDCEYKSPIYQSLRSFYRPLGVMQTLRDLVTDWCGTHLHVTLYQKMRLQPIQQEVFAPLLACLANNPGETQVFWGRTLCKHAQVSSATRYACFNLMSSNETIEYRLPRFCSAEQYLRVVRFCLQMTTYLDTCLDPELPRKHPLSPSQIAQRLLTCYRQTLARPIPTLPSLMKGQTRHV